MKYFEYLAAGVPVVSTPLDFTRYNQAGLKVGADAASFEKAIDQQLERGKLTANETVDFVGENTWGARMDNMLKIVASAI